MARAVCEGAPSCINCILPLFCRWGMQTGVRISSEYLKAFRVTPYHHTLCFYHFCDFQNGCCKVDVGGSLLGFTSNKMANSITGVSIKIICVQSNGKL